MRKTLALTGLVMLLASCGVDRTDTDTAIETESPTSTASVQKCENRSIPAPPAQTDTSKKPTLEIPDGAPPCALVNQDIKIGTGAAAKPGGTVTVHYVGVSWSTNEQFDASWDRGEPVPLSLDQVIPGWREGIPGMKEGGRRRLI